jgi:hypothetical protein
MLFSDRPKNLPYLSDYLQVASSRRPAFETGNLQVGMVALFAAALGAALATVAGADTLPVIMASGVASLASYYWGAKNGDKLATQKPTSEEIQLQEQSLEVVHRLRSLMEKRRLHRDLTGDVSAVLEEASYQWSRARAALLSPYWNKADLSQHMQVVRDNSLKAAERSMQELLILFATSIPEQPGNWNLAEVADEVLGKNVFAGANPRRMSPFFDQAVGLVEQLKALADESEAISRQIVTEPNIGAHARPGAALEATLAELRQIRVAEEELRQDVS